MKYLINVLRLETVHWRVTALLVTFALCIGAPALARVNADIDETTQFVRVIGGPFIALAQYVDRELNDGIVRASLSRIALRAAVRASRKEHAVQSRAWQRTVPPKLAQGFAPRYPRRDRMLDKAG